MSRADGAKSPSTSPALSASMMERLDGVLRQWPVAGVSLLTLAVLLAGLMQTGH